MRLADDAEREATNPLTNYFGGSLGAAVIYYNDFEAWLLHLPRQRVQACIQFDPIIVDSNDDAEERHRS